MGAEELVYDRGVLDEGPVFELGGYGAAIDRPGSVALLPWRDDWSTALSRGVTAHAGAADVGGARFAQAIVHLQKSRAATWQDLAEAWARLEPEGRLLLCGGNDLGVVSAVKRLGRELGQSPRILANRRRARIAAFRRSEGDGPTPPEPSRVEADLGEGEPRGLIAAPGVFSARRLDAGTELLLGALAEQAPPRRVLDLGCGIGPLGLAALLRWPEATAVLADADARAIASAEANAAELGVADRARLVWWDAREETPATDCDLVLVNPPFHTGKAVDLAPARRMFARLAESLAPRGTGIVVANRTLPYERDLAHVGRLRTLAETRSYKLLSLRRSARSSSPRARTSPGARSGGSS